MEKGIAMQDAHTVTDPQKFMGSYEAWKGWGITYAMFRRACTSGDLPSKRTGHASNNKYIVTRGDFHHWISNLPSGSRIAPKPRKTKA